VSLALTTSPFRYYLRVRYGDCDGQKVVYNAKYGEYFDLACTEYLRTALHPRSVFNGDFEMQVVKLVIEWRGPALLDDVVEIRVQPIKFGTSSFVLGFELRRAGEEAVLVTGETVNVHTHRLNDAWIKAPLEARHQEMLRTGAAGKVINHAGEFAGLPRS
jgi:acyl-CoA thioester hydrolase